MPLPELPAALVARCSHVSHCSVLCFSPVLRIPLSYLLFLHLLQLLQIEYAAPYQGLLQILKQYKSYSSFCSILHLIINFNYVNFEYDFKYNHEHVNLSQVSAHLSSMMFFFVSAMFHTLLHKFMPLVQPALYITVLQLMLLLLPLLLICAVHALLTIAFSILWNYGHHLESE